MYILNILIKIPFMDCVEVVIHKVDNNKAKFVPEKQSGLSHCRGLTPASN